MLNEFYSEVYSDRLNVLMSNFKWLNRSYFYNYKVPIVLVSGDKVIAHAGMIPLKVLLNNEFLTVTWYIDFSVLPAFHRKGLGTMITNKYSEFSDIQLALSCNDMSIAVFRKLGWIESAHTFLHINLLAPFNYPGIAKRLSPLLCKILNYISKPFLYCIYKINLSSDASNKIELLNESILKEFINLYNKSINSSGFKDTVKPVRDKDFISWRILNSPNKNKYHIYSSENFKALLLYNNDPGSYIDILWVTDILNYSAIKTMISYLALYGMRNKFSYIRFYTTHIGLSNYLRKRLMSLVRLPRFAIFSKNSDLLNRLRSVEWNWELIDNDFERIQ
jgi:hypothetical protein